MAVLCHCTLATSPTFAEVLQVMDSKWRVKSNFAGAVLDQSSTKFKNGIMWNNIIRV